MNDHILTVHTITKDNRTFTVDLNVSRVRNEGGALVAMIEHQISGREYWSEQGWPLDRVAWWTIKPRGVQL